IISVETPGNSWVYYMKEIKSDSVVIDEHNRKISFEGDSTIVEHTFEGLLKIEKDTKNSIMLRGDIERTKDALKLIFTKYCLPTSRCIARVDSSPGLVTMSASRLFHKRRFSRRGARELSPGSRRRAERLIPCKSIDATPLPPAHKETAGPCARVLEAGEVPRCPQTPFAALPSMRNLAPEIRGGKHERSRRRDPDSEEPQTAGHRSPLRGRRVSGHPDCRSRAEGRRRLYRHAQRAGRLLRGAGLRLSDRPPRRLYRRDRPRPGARSRLPRQCPAKLLANDPVRRRLGDLSRRHGRFPGRAPGADRLAVLQIRAWHRERPAHPLLCRDGNPERDLWPPRRHLSRRARRHHHRQMRRRQSRPSRARARPAAHGGADGEHRGGAEPARTGRAAARSHRQGHGLVPRRERSPRLHRAHPTAVPAFADGQGRDAGRPSAVGGG